MPDRETGSMAGGLYRCQSTFDLSQMSLADYRKRHFVQSCCKQEVGGRQGGVFVTRKQTSDYGGAVAVFDGSYCADVFVLTTKCHPKQPLHKFIFFSFLFDLKPPRGAVEAFHW